MVGPKGGNKKLVGIIVAIVIIGALLTPDIVKMATKAHKEKAAQTTEQSSESNESAAAAEASNSSASNTSQVAENTEEPEEEVEEETGPEHVEYFSLRVGSGMYPYTSGSNDFIFFTEDNKYYAPFAKMLHIGQDSITFTDKNVTRIENDEFRSCVITADGKNYLFNQWTDDPIMLNEKSVNASCVYDDATYMIPTSADGTVGDLYYINSIYEEEQLVASDVVVDTAGINFYSPSYDDIKFLYTKEVGGKRTLILAYTKEETIQKGDFKIYETEVAEGNMIPVFLDIYDYAYYDQDKKELYYVSQDHQDKNKIETKMIYTGNMDEFYAFDDGELYILDGDNVYGFNPSYEKAEPLLSTGIAKLEYHGNVSAYGFHNGHRVYASATSCLLTDKNGATYFGATKESELTQPNRKMGEDKAYYYPCGCYSAILYVKDGVLWIDQYNGVNEETGELNIENFILFDKEKVVDFCSDYGGGFMFVYTEDGNVYFLNADEKEVKLIDSGVDYNQESDIANFAFDYEDEKLYYSKDGNFFRYDIEMDSVNDSIYHEGWKISRDWTYVYITSDGDKTTHLFYGGSTYDCN